MSVMIKIDSPEKAKALQQLLASLAEPPAPQEVLTSSPTIMAKEAYMSEAYQAGFEDTLGRYLDGADRSLIKAAVKELLRQAPTPSSATFAAGALAAVDSLEAVEKDGAKAQGDEYVIVDDEVKCVCGCGKRIRASVRLEGLVDLDLKMNDREVKIITLSPDGAKELAEQLLDARGC